MQVYCVLQKRQMEVNGSGYGKWRALNAPSRIGALYETLPHASFFGVHCGIVTSPPQPELLPQLVRQTPSLFLFLYALPVHLPTPQCSRRIRLGDWLANSVNTNSTPGTVS